MRLTTPTVMLAAAGLSAAQDSLVSRRMTKRGIDADGNFNMSFFHVNDVHAHLDEFTEYGTDCDDPEDGCYGGYARIKKAMDTLRPQYEDSLWLNAGDEFQGTLFYTYYGGEKIAETLNQLGFDAMTIGNHEFDGGDEPLGEFLQNLTFPVISANIVSDNEKLNSTIQPYAIFEDQQIAVIGCTTEDTRGISSPGDGTEFLDVVETVQQTIDEIKSTTNITRIVALTHIGYEEDQALAEGTTGLSLIMGGHSHTLLGDMEDAEGDYPTIVENLDGDEVFVVTAYRWGEYIGYIDVTFDDDGKVLQYNGGPIHMDNSTEQDEDLQAEIEAWRIPFEEFAAEVVGESNVELDQTNCQDGECLLGNFMCDAMYSYRQESATEDEQPDFALINSGGIRATIDEGEITRGEVLTAFPFGNAIIDLVYSGEDVLKIIEGIVSGVNQFNGEEVSSWFQVSQNILIEYNPDNEAGSKVVNIEIGGEALDEEKEYRIVTLDFLAGGGDNFFEATTDFVSLDTQDEVLVDYIIEQTPVDIEIEGRVVTTDETGDDDDSEDTDSDDTDDDTEDAEDSDDDTQDGGVSALTAPSKMVLALAVVFANFALF